MEYVHAPRKARSGIELGLGFLAKESARGRRKHTYVHERSECRRAVSPLVLSRVGNRVSVMHFLMQLHIVLSILAKSLRSLPSYLNSWTEHPSLQSSSGQSNFCSGCHWLGYGYVHIVLEYYIGLRGASAGVLLNITCLLAVQASTRDSSRMSVDGIDSFRWRGTHDARAIPVLQYPVRASVSISK